MGPKVIEEICAHKRTNQGVHGVHVCSKVLDSYLLIQSSAEILRR